MYGRGPKALAEQLGCDTEEAKSIMKSVFDAFPKIEEFDRSSKEFLKNRGYTTTLWGRKRRLPEAKLPEYEFDFSNCYEPFKSNLRWQAERTVEWQNKLSENYWDRNKKEQLKEEWKNEFGAIVKENGAKIARAERQTVNARVQGCLDGNIRVQSKEFGIIKLKDYVNRTLTIWDGQEWTSGTIIASGKKQKCIITFNNGQKFICSPDHRFKVINTRGNSSWKKCSELQPQDHICIDTKYELSTFQYTSDNEHVFGLSLKISDIKITNEYIDMYDVCDTKNGYFIADGLVTHNSAADMSKKALVAINEDEHLRELGFETLVPIHDEVLGQCPLANAKECRDLFTYDMENCAKDKVPLDIKVDPTACFAWYGDEIDLDEFFKENNLEETN